MRQDRDRVEPPANAAASGCLGPRPAASSTDGESSEREAHDIEAHPLGQYRDRVGLNIEMVYQKVVETLGPEHVDETPQQQCLAT